MSEDFEQFLDAKSQVVQENERLKKQFAIMYDKIALAETLHEKTPFFYDRSEIFWFWNYVESKYEMWDETDIMNLIDDSFGSMGVKSKIKQETLEAIRRVGRKKTPKNAKKTWIQTKSGIYDCETSLMIETTPEYFLTNPIPWKVGLNDNTPTMDKIFKEWVGEGYVKTLYEILAYSLLADYPIHRIFCFIGSGMNGKSKFLDLLKTFIGIENISSTQLDMIAGNGKSRFETIKLYKKLVCVMGETNFSLLSETNVLKQITGQDLVSFEIKNKTPFVDFSYAKILIATNSLPPTTDKTIGFYRRWLIIDFPNTFSEKKDILKEIPREEYESLLKKCLGILTELLKKGEFSNEGNIEERKQRYEDKSDPVQKFINERTEKSFDDYIYKYDFRDEFLIWCSKNGIRKWNEREITARMKDLGYEEMHKGENRYRAYVGIKWLLGDIFTTKKNEANRKNTTLLLAPIRERQIENSVLSVRNVHNDIINILLDCENKEIDVLKLESLGFSSDEIEKAKKEGIVFENPKGTIRLMR